MLKWFWTTSVVLSLIICSWGQEESSDWSQNVTRNSEGQVLIENIPQVAQRGGYCVPASTEMVLRYYGAKYSNKRLGGLFRSGRSRGTYTHNVEAAFTSSFLAKAFQFKKLYSLWESWDEREKMLSEYIKLEPRKGKIRKRDFFAFEKMDAQIAKRAFTNVRRPTRYLLESAVKLYIDKGHPLSWDVFLSLDSATESTGGHWRIICGYEMQGDSISNILYRDSWGKEVVVKKATLTDAANMTDGLYVIAPKTCSLPTINPKNFDTKVVVLPGVPPIKLVRVHPHNHWFPSNGGKFMKMKDFYMGQYEITQEQYSAVVGTNPSIHVGDNRPVENVSWENAIDFCKKLTMLARRHNCIASNEAFTLPLVDQYSVTRSYSGANENDTEIRPVGQKSPGKWELYDIDGNVFEWAREKTNLGGRNQQGERTGFRVVLITIGQEFSNQ